MPMCKGYCYECHCRLYYNVLLKAFIFIAIYAARVRPTFMRIRAGFRAWFDAKIAVARIQVREGSGLTFSYALLSLLKNAHDASMFLYISIPSTFRLYNVMCLAVCLFM